MKCSTAFTTANWSEFCMAFHLFPSTISSCDPHVRILTNQPLNPVGPIIAISVRVKLAHTTLFVAQWDAGARILIHPRQRLHPSLHSALVRPSVPASVVSAAR